MASVSIQKRKIEREKGVVILPLKEYHRLLVQAVPTYHLTGKAAERLDQLVERGIKEYRAGRTRKIRSLAELD